MDTIAQIRENEKKSHIEQYSKLDLYQTDSWLSKPIKTVLELLPYLDAHKSIRCLDLGCGVGRNCIAVAQRFSEIPCTIDCVDHLDLAIEKLMENARVHRVAANINGITDTIENFAVPQDSYDLILAVSSLEHVESVEHFTEKLQEIRDGIKAEGVVCLVINSGVTETNSENGEKLQTQFEVNLDTAALQALLKQTFGSWNWIKSTLSHQHYSIPRGSIVSSLETDVVTLVAQKSQSNP